MGRIKNIIRLTGLYSLERIYIIYVYTQMPRIVKKSHLFNIILRFTIRCVSQNTNDSRRCCHCINVFFPIILSCLYPEPFSNELCCLWTSLKNPFNCLASSTMQLYCLQQIKMLSNDYWSLRYDKRKQQNRITQKI